MLQLSQYGGYSSVAERRSVAADVVGSTPTSRPNPLPQRPRDPVLTARFPARHSFPHEAAYFSWHLGLGLRLLETRILSRRCLRKEVPLLLLHSIEFR